MAKKITRTKIIPGCGVLQRRKCQTKEQIWLQGGGLCWVREQRKCGGMTHSLTLLLWPNLVLSSHRFLSLPRCPSTCVEDSLPGPHPDDEGAREDLRVLLYLPSERAGVPIDDEMKDAFQNAAYWPGRSGGTCARWGGCGRSLCRVMSKLSLFVGWRI